MGMPKGLARATAYYNKITAWADWQKLAAEMTAAGYAELVAQYRPPEEAGWRKTDKASARLKAAVAGRQKAGTSAHHTHAVPLGLARLRA